MAGLGDIALDIGRKASTGKGSGKIANIIDFVESPWGLKARLYPVQRVILKAHYGIPLDDRNKIVNLTDWRREDSRMMTEADYLKFLFDAGRCNIREVDHERREMILSVGRRSGKCNLGDSLILTNKGVTRIDALGDPNGPEFQPLEIEVAQEADRKAISKFFYNGGVKPTRTLTTRCGYRLGGTDNHRIKVLTQDGIVDWKYLADIQVGDTVCIHRKTDLWASEYVDCTPYWTSGGLKKLTFPTLLDEDWGFLLGLLAGDGTWVHKTGIELTVADIETKIHARALWDQLFGSHKEQQVKESPITSRVQFFSVAMRQFLHNLGWELGIARDAKMVPWSIMRSPKSVVQAFLRGLFETDGGVESGGKVVSFSTASGRLAREVQTLLLNLGIVSRIKPKPIKGKIYWILCVRGLRSRIAFAELVGFDSHKKMDPLLASIEAAGKEGSNAEGIPYQRPWLRKLLESVPALQGIPGHKQEWSRSKLRAVLGNTLKPSTAEEVTYPMLLNALPVARSLGADLRIIAHFEELQRLDYFFDPIETIEEGEHPVYDLNVPDGESFVANGMTNHNTMISALISVYEMYKLIQKGNPQHYYALPQTNNIQIISVATDKDQAGILYNEASGYFRSCDFFQPYTANNTLSYARFQSPEDIQLYGPYAEDPTAKATLRMTFRSCVAKGLRGAGNLVVILDEVAHFTDSGQSSASAVYDAVQPSTATFFPKDPKDPTTPLGPGEGRTILISSPLGREGMFYKLFEIGFKGGEAAENMLCVQAPTWEVNPTVPASEFKKHFAKDAKVFFTEFGADFSDRTRGWIEREKDLTDCIKPDAKPTYKAAPRQPHFLGLDVGLVNDGTAIAIGHNEGDLIVLDIMDYIRAGEGKYVHHERLEFEDVAQWVYEWTRRFHIKEGIFDKHLADVMEQYLTKKGIGTLVSQRFTPQERSDVYQSFKDMMYDRRLVLYDAPIVSGEIHCAYIKELLELQAETRTKYITEVRAPNIEGKHDDMSDALTRMVWLASQAACKTHHIAVTSGATSRDYVRDPMLSSSSKAVMRRHRMTRSGSSPERMIPRGGRLGRRF